ncbi:hypothetical protein G0U57_000731, partial [Chelydra serpentina]
VSSVLCVREDLLDMPLANPDLILFTDGSSFYSEGQRFAGYAVTSQWDIIEAASLPGNWGAQAAELYALARACQLATGKTVSIYTDSHYAFGVIPCHIHLWRFCGFQTATGKPIQHVTLVHRLLNALQAPRTVAIVHCRAHTRENTPVTQGNALADQATKAAAIQPLALPTLALASTPFLPL